MTQAIWNGAVLASSDDIALVEGNAYFPPEAVDWKYFRDSSATRPTYCHWKGFAKYHDLVVDGAENEGAAWYYDAPYQAAHMIRDRIAFWRGVDVIGAPEGRGLVEQLPAPRDGKTGWQALCWLMKSTEQKTFSQAEITANTDIAPGEIEAAWRVYDVERYASRYGWRLVKLG
ncbi:MAG: DUF427 domain-containing protein, partial [Rhodospirillales bacterium]|nr:DUF427 domain-containing protein [Rhodospirillales bacterium]